MPHKNIFIIKEEYKPALWIGFENYKTILTDPVFKQAMINSVLLGTISLFINLFVALILTVALNEIKNKFTKSALQTVSFLPYLFSWTVVGGMWIFILSHNGIVNTALKTLGLEKIGFFTTASMGRPVILFTNAWKQAGYFCVLFLASVVGIDPALYEAAIIDGASRMKQIRYIVLPQLIPPIATLLVVGATGVLRNFDQVLMMARPVTKDSIRTVLLYIYEEGIIQSKTGKATAAAVIVLLVTMVITTESKFYTLPIVLRQITTNIDSTSGSTYIAPNAQMAAIVITVIPLIILYTVAQRFLIGGLTVGAAKG